MIHVVIMGKQAGGNFEIQEESLPRAHTEI